MRNRFLVPMLAIMLTTAAAPARSVAPPDVKITRDVAYGSDPAQRFDVYSPRGAKNAPVLFVVHGGGWRAGDKDSRAVVENKVAHWTARGFVVISANYRLLPDADPLHQANDIIDAIAKAQKDAGQWGGDASRLVLMGHSAGAHLVALISTWPRVLAEAGVRPWRGTVVLDSAALDLVSLMRAPHLPLYDDAFGDDPQVWRAASPYASLGRGVPPMLVVCSSRRVLSCAQAHEFVKRSTSLGNRASVLEENLSHRQINETLGESSAYTRAVDAFVDSAVR